MRPQIRRGRIVDRSGFQLSLANLPGGSFTDCHDECGIALLDLLSEAGVRLQPEPRFIFTSLIPAPVLTEARTPPAIVPDACGEVSLPAAATARHARRGPALPSRMLLFDVKNVLTTETGT